MKNATHRHRPLTATLAVLLCGALAGCQGGGSPTSPTTPQDPTTAQIEFTSYSLINQARSDHGVRPQLELSQELAAVAREYSRYMRDANFFSHRDPRGRDVNQRLAEAGISVHVVGENLARIDNSPNPAAWAHEQLMASSSHRPNILGPQFVMVGTGVATDGTSFWLTQIFVQP